MRRSLTKQERYAVKRLIDRHVRKGQGIPEAQVSRTDRGDPTKRFTDDEMLAAVRSAGRALLERQMQEHLVRSDEYLSEMDAFLIGERRSAPVPPRRPALVLGMRTYNDLRDRANSPSHNTIRRRHGSFQGFVNTALKEGL